MRHEHKEGQKCFLCEGGTKEELQAWQDEKLAKNGFYMHFVPDDPFINAHTHGFEKTWGHLDMQIVFPIDTEIVSSIFWSFADRIKAGEVFRDVGIPINGIIRNFPVKLMQAKEDGRDVLRVLLPDKNGKFPGDVDVDPAFDHQAHHAVGGEFSPPDSALN